MSGAGPRITYHLLLKTKVSGHYVKAGQQIMRAAPRTTAAIDLAFEGRLVRGIVDQVHTPPGCEEHCIGTLFISEI